MAILPRVRPLLEGSPVVSGDISVVHALFGDDGGVREGSDAETGANDTTPALPACDRATLAAMYGTLAPRVHRFLSDLLSDGTLASDATQETFVRAFRRVDDLPRTTRLVPWVFGVARYVALETRKARGRGRKLIDDSKAADERAVDTRGRSPEAELLDREAVAVVARALERLSEERRAALLLRCDHGLAYDEIAPLLGWSLAKVKVEIFRARETLRATLEEYRGQEAALPPCERSRLGRAGGGS